MDFFAEHFTFNGLDSPYWYHRITGLLRLTLEVIWSNPSAQGKRHLRRVVQGDVQTFWNISKNEDFTTSLGNLYHCFVTLTFQRSFIMFRCNFLFWNLCSLPLILEAACPEFVSVFFTASLQIFIYILGFPLSLFTLRSPVPSVCPHMRQTPIP